MQTQLEQQLLESLLLETELLLNESKWKDAQKNCEKLLKINPSCAKAYFYTLLISLKSNNKESLVFYKGALKENKLFEKAYAYADEEFKQELDELKFKNAFKTAIETSSKKAKKLKKRRKNLVAASNLLQDFAENTEAQEKLALWQEQIAELDSKILLKKKRTRRFFLISATTIVFAIALFFLYTKVLSPFIRYNSANKAFEKQNYEKAYNTFLELGDYKDSEVLIADAGYNYAIDLKNQEKFVEAYKLLEKYGNPDSEEYKLCMYHTAINDKNNGSYSEAISKFESLGNYNDSESLLIECKYLFVKANYNNYNETTYSYLTKLKEINYQDSASLYNDLYTLRVESWVTIYGDMDEWNELLLKNGKDLLTKETYKLLDQSESDLRLVNAPYCFNFELKGGTPGFSTKIRYVINNMGVKSEKWSDYTVRNGDWFWYTVRSFDDVGTITVKIYDESNNLIGEDSIVCK